MLVGTTILGFYLVCLVVLLLVQRHMIYIPSAYEEWELPTTKQKVAKVEFSTGEGRQVAWYIPPRAGDVAAGDGPLWIACAGNASRALNWSGFAAGYPDDRASFLLLDYPGYGMCEGRPSPAAIRESGRAAIEALARQLGVEQGALTDDVNLLGHSLGAAAALHLSQDLPARRVILISPFTSLRAMARRQVGPLFSWILRHHLDNDLRLRELAARDPRPVVHIFHGDQDTVIPVQMSRDFAAAHPDMIVYTEGRNLGHENIIDVQENRIYAAMMGDVE